MEVKVLVVEDNTIFNKILCRKLEDLSALLEESGNTLKIFSEETAAGAETVIKQEKPDIAVLDYLFDDYSGDRRTGIELLEMMMIQDENAKVVMISKEHDTDVISEAKEIGAKAFISKDNQLMAMGQLDVAIREFMLDFN